MPFRWPALQNDIDLAKEVIAKNPEKPCDWDAIAICLQSLFSETVSKPVEIKGRSCRERMERLIKKYKDEDAASLKRYV
jgi:hypothetical protein